MKPTLPDGYAYASSKRYPKEPETVMVSGMAHRYKYVGAWFDSKDGQRKYQAFRKQSGEGSRYLFVKVDFAPRYW